MATIEFFFGRTEDEADDIPQSQFHCLLDDQPSYLLPANLPLENQNPDPSVGLILNPQCWFSWDGPAPQEVAWYLPFLSNFFFGLDTVWVADPIVRGLMPFWVGPQVRSLLAELRPGGPIPATMPTNICSTLSGAEVFVDPGHIERRRAEWANSSTYWAAHFRMHGYSTVPGLIHPFHVASLRRYYRHLIRAGALRLGDSQCRGRYVAHNESVARFFHYQLAAAVSQVAGAPVKPSYVYVAAYQGGAELPKHKDREQCEYSLSLCIDHSPPDREGSWPLFLETNEDATIVLQRIGEGVVYKGRDIAHYREPLPEDSTAIFLLLHYVLEEYSGTLD
jgi:hypothetical protein